MRQQTNLMMLLLLTLASIPRRNTADILKKQPHEASGATSALFVEQQTDCMTIADIKQAVGSVIEGREETQYMIVSVVVSPAVTGSLASLRVIDRETGEILLERNLQVADEECGDAHRVLKVMMEQFLTGFPIEKWKEKQDARKAPPKPVIQTQKIVIKKQIVPLKWLLILGLDSRWPTPNGDLELVMGVDAGGKKHGVISHLIFRGSPPRSLGEGQYFETDFLLGLGLRYTITSNLLMRLDLRSGAKRVGGLRYETNHHRWVILLEAQLALFFSLGQIHLGPQIALSPLFHSVFTETGNKEDLSFFRVGLALYIPLGRSSLK